MDIDISLTYRCPLRCRFCSIKKVAGKEFVWQSWVDVVSSFGHLEQVSLVSLEGGEPFLMRDLPSLTKALLRTSGSVKIITSGAISPADFISVHGENANVRVEVSIDGRKPIHNYLRDGSFDKASSTLSKLLATKMDLAVRTVISTANIEDYLAFLEEMESLAASAGRDLGFLYDVIISPQHLMADGVFKKQNLRCYPVDQLVPAPAQIVRLYRHLKSRTFGHLNFQQDEPFRGCSFGRKTFVSLSPTGEYSFCCEKEESMGNVFSSGVSECYARISKFRQDSPCRKCGFLAEDMCGGCGNGSKCGLTSHYGYSHCSDLIKTEVMIHE